LFSLAVAQWAPLASALRGILRQPHVTDTPLIEEFEKELENE